MAKLDICLICETRYETLEEAEACECRHAVTPAMRARGLRCVFCDHDLCTCLDGRPQPLAPEQILRLGALTLAQEQSQAIEALLDAQEATYREALRTHGPEVLIEALLARDRLLAQQGRQVADQRTGSRLLREFMRAALYTAEGRGSIEAAEQAIKRLGGEAADARQLKLHGSTLGPLEHPEQIAQRLADGTQKAR